MSSRLSHLGSQIHSTQQANTYMDNWHQLLQEATLGHLYWQQRLKEKRIQLGDLPTKFFYGRIRGRKKRNHIYTLKNAQGMWIDKAVEIEETITTHFQNLYTTAQNPGMDNEEQLSENIDLVFSELDLPQLSASNKLSLQAPFTAQEIKDAMDSIHSNKSPGNDGFSSAFFHAHWDTVGDTVVRAVQHFLHTGFLLREWNQTILVLIPKITPLEEVHHLRPISLCNTIYKCASKCMVNRMKPLLPNLISNYQNAFIPGRHMEDNILISHKLLHVINKQWGQQQHLAALKLDMNKAYDRVSWTFVLKTLTAYGFPPTGLILCSNVSPRSPTEL